MFVVKFGLKQLQPEIFKEPIIIMFSTQSELQIIFSAWQTAILRVDCVQVGHQGGHCRCPADPLQVWHEMPGRDPQCMLHRVEAGAMQLFNGQGMRLQGCKWSCCTCRNQHTCGSSGAVCRIYMQAQPNSHAAFEWQSLHNAGGGMRAKISTSAGRHPEI